MNLESIFLNINIKVMSVDLIRKDFDNKAFESEVSRLEKEQEIENVDKLNKLSKYTGEKSIYDLTLREFLYEWKETWIELLNDIIHVNLSIDSLTQKNRLLFVGLTFVIFAIFWLILRI